MSSAGVPSPGDAPDHLVSVVITCYNQARFLAEAIESALGQTHTRLEVIVVDDGSTDGTAAVAARAGVRCISQPRAGLAAARNTGLRESRGPFLLFLDADDRLLPSAVATGLAALEGHPTAAAAVGHHRTIGADGSVLHEWPWQPTEGDGFVALLRRNYVGMHAAVLYRREALEEVGGFDPRLAACEDYDILLRIARRHPLRNHGGLVAEYRQHGGNMSADPALMLRAALLVHQRQWRIARKRAADRKAFMEGREFWQAYYGQRIIARLRAGRGRYRTLGAMAADLWLLARHYRRGALRAAARALWRRVVPKVIRARVSRRQGAAAADARFGSLRRVTPISTVFGFDRGLPVDRHYIERFLDRHAVDVHGRVLEVGDREYTRRFGGGRVIASDVLHVTPGNPHATIVSDLAQGDHLPPETFDCIILTQTLHLIYETRAAVRTLHRILKPEGVVLATVPGITAISHDEWGARWYWSFTALSMERLFDEAFPGERVTVETFGNVLAAAAFLYGLAASELTIGELDYRDPHYPVIVAVRAVRTAR